MAFASSVNILGTEYSIYYLSESADPLLKTGDMIGYCEAYTHKIVVGDLSAFSGYSKESAKRKTEIMKETLRHEIVHAFFNESGLMESSNQYSGAWAHNEELVDWIALQGGKIYKAWKAAGAL